MDENNWVGVWHGDCFEMMDQIEPQSVDAIITDPPYGTTALPWDQKLDLDAWWEAAGRVIKPSGVIVMFSAQPFTTDLINSNRKQFRYELIWRKSMASGFLDANRRPMRIHENIVVFSQHYRRSKDGKRAATTYNPQFTLGKPYKKNQQKIQTAHYNWEGVMPAIMTQPPKTKPPFRPKVPCYSFSPSIFQTTAPCSFKSVIPFASMHS
ncbi:MAG TPA: hypothetical protein DCP32_11860 [Anaerolineaceae bacterium]|nr:hypothetical protein [Anaerolineaceae bacterium]HBA91887.1 hypothetical protein [Anaerolineaceae bacterium]